MQLYVHSVYVCILLLYITYMNCTCTVCTVYSVIVKYREKHLVCVCVCVCVCGIYIYIFIYIVTLHVLVCTQTLYKSFEVTENPGEVHVLVQVIVYNTACDLIQCD